MRLREKMPPPWDRREFLRRASLLIPAMHFSGWANAEPRAERVGAPAQRPVEFLRLRMHTSRLAELPEFYGKVLGLPIAAESRDSLTIRAGGTELQFDQTGDATNPFYHFAFNIPENKLERAIEWMSGRAPLIPRPGTGSIVFHYPHWNAHSIYFFDPAGNILEFIARHNLQNAASGPFDTRDILHASEMGLVVPEVAVAVSSLKEKLGIGDYIGMSDIFAPVGDEHGLFIVVRTGRKWFSAYPAAVFPAEVRLRGAAPAQHSIPAGALLIEVTR